MKRAILLGFSLTLIGCVSGAGENPDLTPLPTTGPQPPKTVVVTKPDTEPLVNIMNYIDQVRENSPIAPFPSDEELVELATTWCDFMERGMNRTNITAWIEEMASTQDEVDTWLVSAQASATYICPEQEYKWNP